MLKTRNELELEFEVFIEIKIFHVLSQFIHCINFSSKWYVWYVWCSKTSHSLRADLALLHCTGGLN